MENMVDNLCGFKFQLEGSDELIELKIRPGNKKEYLADLIDGDGDAIHPLCSLTKEGCEHLAEALDIASILIREWEARDDS